MKGRLLFLAGVGGMLAAAYAAGFFELVTDRERVRALIEGLGIWGPLAYMAVFAFFEPFFVPGIAFMAPGALVWGAPELFAYSLVGATGAGVVGFSFARYLARDYVEPRLPERLRGWNDRVADEGLRAVVLVRLTFFLAPPAHWLLGVSRVSLPTFVLGTVLGFAPWIAALSFVLVVVGGTLWDWLAAQPAAVWWALGAGLVAWGAVRWATAARRRRRAAVDRLRT